MRYLYRHIRLDKNVPFYIGVGSKMKGRDTDRSVYNRAFLKIGRNEIWHRIVNKTEYDVEIIWECESEEEIISKEMEFIALYGRLDLRTGTLANMDGGGQLVGSLSEIARKKIGDTHRGRKISEEVKLKISRFNKGKVYSDERRKQMSEISKKRGWPNHKEVVELSAIKRRKPVLQMTLDEKPVKEWESIKAAAKNTGTDDGDIGKCCKGKKNQSGGYKWAYINNQNKK